MNFLDGTQITRLGDKVKNLSHKKRKMAMDRILHRVAEAYGRQLLYGGLFQADGHPGNILVMKGMLHLSPLTTSLCQSQSCVAGFCGSHVCARRFVG